MGCDIHLWTEVRRNGKWETAGAWVENRYYESEDNESVYNRPRIREEFYGSRNYSLFALLAGVRGEHPDAPPLAPDRGLPADVSAEVQKYSDLMAGDGHSHTYLTLREILDFAYGNGYGQRGENRFADYSKEFAEETIRKLTVLAKDPALTADDVRIVFWFDN